MGDMKIQGSQGLFYRDAEVQTVKLKQGTTEDQVKAATYDNNLDEIVLRDARGQLHVAYADELSIQDGEMPKEGDVVTVDFVEGAAEVVHVDDEWNEDYYTGPLTRLLSDSRLEGNDSGIQALASHNQTVLSDEEFDWAKQMESKVMQGHQPSEEETARYSALYDKLKNS